MDSRNQSYAGRKLKTDLFTDKGVFVLPALTVLTEEQLQLIDRHGIMLEERDIVPVYDHPTFFQKSMDDATRAMESIFVQIRSSKKLPLMEIKEEILPYIFRFTESSDFFGILASLQSKDDYTYRHNLAVGVLSALLGKWLKMPPEFISRLALAATLHDIGKIMIPDEIINKEDMLSKEEFEIMKKHTTYGYQLISDTPGTTHEEALVALQHHERMDGSGYPFGIQGHRITDYSKIVSVVDIFHAMTSNRRHRSALPLYEVLSQMRRSVFGALDPQISSVFVNRLMESMIGNEVVFTDGSTGRIIMVLSHDPLRPLVQIGEEFVDLSRVRELDIARVLPQQDSSS